MEANSELISARDRLTNAVQVIKDAILQSQQRALSAVNQEQLALYFGIGRYISANTRTRNWGKGFIEGISEQLRKELPGLRGFSARNLRICELSTKNGKALKVPIRQFKLPKYEVTMKYVSCN